MIGLWGLLRMGWLRCQRSCKGEKYEEAVGAPQDFCWIVSGIGVIVLTFDTSTFLIHPCLSQVFPDWRAFKNVPSNATRVTVTIRKVSWPAAEDIPLLLKSLDCSGPGAAYHRHHNDRPHPELHQ
jgi:hypothetical protein